MTKTQQNYNFFCKIKMKTENATVKTNSILIKKYG